MGGNRRCQCDLPHEGVGIDAVGARLAYRSQNTAASNCGSRGPGRAFTGMARRGPLSFRILALPLVFALSGCSSESEGAPAPSSPAPGSPERPAMPGPETAPVGPAISSPEATVAPSAGEREAPPLDAPIVPPDSPPTSDGPSSDEPGAEESPIPDPAGNEETPANEEPPTNGDPSPAEEPPTPPGTRVFGDETLGGIGGTVIRVTTLAPTGAGSLGEALALEGPRVIVFEVGGIIDLGRARLVIAEPFVTIAGQTAPSPGITLIRGGLTVRTHDVRIEHLRLRMGDAGAAPGEGFEPDATTDGAAASDIVFDHVSVAWGVDENLSVSGPRFDGPQGTSRAVTIKNSIIAEGLNESVHEKGAHSMGTLIHDYCSDVAVVGNLYAHNDERNPWFKGFATGVIVNNVVYDPGTWAMRLGAVLNEWVDSGITPDGPRVSIVSNVMRHGPSTPPERAMVSSNSNGSAYLEDNLAFDAAGRPATVVDARVVQLSERPTWPIGLDVLPAAQVFERVLASAGARPRERDAVDARIVAEVRAGTGALVDSQDEVGGYPTAAPTRRTLDVPANVENWLDQLASELE
jgi:hypothetical protein